MIRWTYHACDLHLFYFSFILAVLTSMRLIKSVNEVVNRDFVSCEASRVLSHGTRSLHAIIKQITRSINPMNTRKYSYIQFAYWAFIFPLIDSSKDARRYGQFFFFRWRLNCWKYIIGYCHDTIAKIMRIIIKYLTI